MKKLDYAMVFVSNMARSVEFYRDVLGLPLQFESAKWTEFATEGCTVALHLAEVATSDPSEGHKVAGRLYPGFQVDDRDAFHQQILSKGVTCLQPPKAEDFG